MFEERLQKILKTEEVVVLIVRKYPLVFTGQILIATLFIIGPFFFMYVLFQLGGYGVVGFVVALLIGIILAVRVVVVYSFNVFIITEERIIDVDQQGFFRRTVSETTYEKIQDVSIKIHGIMQTILHYGSVVIQTAGTQANIELHGVKNPEHVQQNIINIQNTNAPQEEIVSGSDVASAIKTLNKVQQDNAVEGDDE